MNQNGHHRPTYPRQLGISEKYGWTLCWPRSSIVILVEETICWSSPPSIYPTHHELF